MDPTESIRSRMRSAGDISVDYTEVMILKDDGSEVSAKFALKDEDLDLAFVLPVKGVDVNSSEVPPPFLLDSFDGLSDRKFLMKWYHLENWAEICTGNQLSKGGGSMQ